MKEIDGRKIAIDWSLPREVYEAEKNAQKSEEPESEPEEEDEESENDSEPENDPLADLVEESENSDSEESDSDEDDKIEDEKPRKPINGQKRKSEPAPDVLEGRSVFLRNVPFDATEEDLEELCGKYGNVKKARIVKNDAGASKGVAFVEVNLIFIDFNFIRYAYPKNKSFIFQMETKEEADECVVNTKSLSINGRPVFARISLPQSQLDQKKKVEIEEKKAKRDKRNLALAREGEIREGTEAWKVSL